MRGRSLFIFFLYSVANGQEKSKRNLQSEKKEIKSSNVTYMVSIECRYDTSLGWVRWCSGSLVGHEQWVMTAAHCLDVGNITDDKIRVKDSAGELLGTPGQIFIYPEFSLSHNLALFQLTNLTDKIKKKTFLFLPTRDFDGHLIAGERKNDQSLRDRIVEVISYNDNTKWDQSDVFFHVDDCYSGPFFPFDFEKGACLPLNETYGVQYNQEKDIGSAVTWTDLEKRYIVGVITHVTYNYKSADLFNPLNGPLMTVLVRVQLFMEWIVKTICDNHVGGNMSTFMDELYRVWILKLRKRLYTQPRSNETKIDTPRVEIPLQATRDTCITQ